MPFRLYLNAISLTGYRRCSRASQELLNREIFTAPDMATVLTRQLRKGYNQVNPHNALGYSLSAIGEILIILATDKVVLLLGVDELK